MMGMRKTRSAAAASLAAAGLLLSACGGDAGGDEPAPTSEPSPLASFDPCTVLTPEELQQHGLASPGEPSDLGVGEVGCDFTSDTFYAGILKAEGHDMAYWEERRDNFDEFTPNTVGSHQGFSGVAAGGKDQGVCRQIMEVGGGSVIVDITYIDPTGLAAKDPCADAMEIAQLVEPKLPA